MATHFKRGGTILIPYQEGWSISDSQGKPRIYKTRAAFEKAFPKHYIGTEGVELVEYAEVRHGEWRDVRMDTVCSVCGEIFSDDLFWITGDCVAPNYCPNCGAKMDGGKQDG